MEVNTDGKFERGSIEPAVYNESLPRIESDRAGIWTDLFFFAIQSVVNDNDAAATTAEAWQKG